MPSRKELRGVTNDLAASFVSRNNDVGGYWGLGQLYKHARKNRTSTLVIDLISGRITPYSPVFSERIGFYVERLRGHMYSRNMPVSWMLDAKIYVSFYPDERAQKYFALRNNCSFICVVEVTSDEGRAYIATRRGHCWSHNPLIESMSLRI